MRTFTGKIKFSLYVTKPNSEHVVDMLNMLFISILYDQNLISLSLSWYTNCIYADYKNPYKSSSFEYDKVSFTN